MRKLLAILLSVIMLISLASCNKTEQPVADDQTAVSDTETTEEPEPAPPTAAEIYSEAAERVNAQVFQSLEVEITRKMTVGNDVFDEVISQDIVLNNIGGENFSAKVDEISTFDNFYNTASEKAYLGGSLYIQSYGANYIAEMTADDFCADLIPAVLLDADLYGKVEEMADGNISFSEPKGIESWVSDLEVEFVDGNGVAQFNRNGDLIGSTYTVTYIQGPAEITDEISVTILTAQSETEITAPVDAAECVVLTDAKTIDILNRASMLWTASDSLEVFASYAYTTEAAASYMTYATEIALYGTGSNMMADYDYDLMIADLNYGETYEYTQEEEFIDGQYYISSDGEERVSQSGITAMAFKDYCFTEIATWIPANEDIAAIEISDLGSAYLIEYTFTEEAGMRLEDTVTYDLFSDENFIDDYAESYRTETAKGYMGVDKYTGLPTSVNLAYQGYHTIEGDEYLLDFECSKTIYAASLSAYENICDKTYISGETYEEPTPLFYHVTGEDGQEMWLFGTIHVGDERTMYLPDEIKTAFDASDAFALELDADAFADQMDDDPEFLAQVIETYIYTDGSTTKEHISDEVLYEDAVKLMKVSGEYSKNFEYIKVNMWSSTIDNFMMRQGYEFTSEYGVESILEHWADETDKELIEVESTYDQLLMMSEFSDELQEVLLYGSVYTDIVEYNSGIRELFDLWCKGDEEAIFQYLYADDTELTEEEIAINEEYANAVEHERNAKMLNVAVDFLESGDVIFYAVGLAHLIAEDGLVNTLRAAGYTVELVTYN